MAGSNSAKRKLVYLDVHLPEVEFPFEFSIENPENSGKSDLETVVEHVVKKKPCLKKWLHETTFDFQIESERRPGKWVSVGDNSPLKEQSNLKCFFLSIPFNGYQNTTSKSSENLNKGKETKNVYCKNFKTCVMDYICNGKFHVS